MRLFVWVLLGWVSAVLVAALSTRLPWVHLVADVPVVVVAFLATRTGAREAATVAAVLGFSLDATACAPLGLHASALVATALLMAQVGGHLGGTGAGHFALVSGFAELCYHLLLVGLLGWQGHKVGFVSWPFALLLPAAACCGTLGLLVHAKLEALHGRLTPAVRRGLQWR